MTPAPHPSYPNPTIQEAICNIHFGPSDGVAWRPSWYGEFFKQVEEHFPTFQPVSALQLKLQLTQRLPESPGLVIPQLMRYQHASGSVLIQLSEGRIAVHVLPQYPGWDKVKEHIRYAWEKLTRVVDPALITRVGLRYINRIERSQEAETLDTWLGANDYVPLVILRSQPGFASRVEAQLDSRNRIAVVVADAEPGPGSYGAFILDIDRTADYQMVPDPDLLLEEAHQLHEHVWKVFQSTKGEKLERLLQGDIL